MKLLTPFLTKSGWVYSLSSTFSKDEYLGYPMYYPQDEGDKLVGNIVYTKFSRIAQLKNELKQPYKLFTVLDPWTVIIPKSEILHFFDTYRALESILSDISLVDPRKVLIEILISKCKISETDLGIGGSYAVGCPTPTSDIDLIVYGSKYVYPIVSAVEDMLRNYQITMMSEDIVLQYAQRYKELYVSTPFNDLKRTFAFDVSKIYTEGKKLSIIFSYDQDEYREVNPLIDHKTEADKLQKKYGEGVVISSVSSWMYPRKYTVQDIDGIFNIWSFHWLHKSLCSAGDNIKYQAHKFANGERILFLSTLDDYISKL